MSWVSDAEHWVESVIHGKKPGAIVNDPKTPLEQAINTTAAAAAPTAETLVSTLETEAKTDVANFKATVIGAVDSGAGDTALKALATTALESMEAAAGVEQGVIANAITAALASAGVKLPTAA